MKSLHTSKLLPNRLTHSTSKKKGCYKNDVNRFGPEIRQNSYGFTVIELMVVIAIIAILVGIGIPAYSHYLYRAKVIAAVAKIKDINTAIEAYRAGTDELPPDLASIDFENLIDPWGNPYQYVNLEAGGSAVLSPSFASAKGGTKVRVTQKREIPSGKAAQEKRLLFGTKTVHKDLLTDAPNDGLFKTVIDVNHTPNEGLIVDDGKGVIGVRPAIQNKAIQSAAKGGLVTARGYIGNKDMLKGYTRALCNTMRFVDLPLVRNGVVLAKKNNSGGGSAEGKEDGNGLPINTDYDLYSMGKDGKTNKKITHEHSEDDIIRGDNGTFFGPVSKFQYRAQNAQP